jgi:hypothetical protein
MAHVRVGGLDEGLDLLIDRPDDIRRQQILDDHGTILDEGGENLVGGCVGVNPLE